MIKNMTRRNIELDTQIFYSFLIFEKCMRRKWPWKNASYLDATAVEM